jgi:hypothetical protein
MTITHVPAHCSVIGCTREATRWIADVGGQDTFYLCADHMPESDGVYSAIGADGTITNHEIAVYACADDCDICNL